MPRPRRVVNTPPKPRKPLIVTRSLVLTGNEVPTSALKGSEGPVKSAPRRTRRSPKLTDIDREVIMQLYASTGSMREAARRFGCCEATARTVINAKMRDPHALAGRARALDEMAGKVHAVADRVIDSIAPSELESEWTPKQSADGAFTGWSLRGPSLRDKVAAVGVLADKVRLLNAARFEALSGTIGNTIGSSEADLALMYPASIDDARRLIAQKVRRLRILDVEFHVDDPNTSARISELAQTAKIEDVALDDAGFPLG